MDIKIQNKRYKLNRNLSYTLRLKIVNFILKRHDDYFSNKFENGSVKYLLDILGEYLYYGTVVDGICSDIKSDNQSYWLSKKELSSGVESVEIDRFSKKFKEKHKKVKPIISEKRYSKSKIHKLNTIYIPIVDRINKIIRDSPMKHLFYFHNEICHEEVGKWKYEGKEFDVKIDTNCFTKEDQQLPYINKVLPYLSNWCYVDNNNEFNFCCFKFKIKEKYNYDSVLVMVQNNIMYYIDYNINPIDENKIINLGVIMSK